MASIRTLRMLVVMSMALSAAGCYYLQAARGQMEVLNKREPVEDVVGDPGTPEDLSRQLRLVQEAREFSVERLELPDNLSYRTYADLERDFVIWNVFATPEFSLAPHEWCYPIVGCVAYRGYFTYRDARRKAERLAGKGYDVAIGGVPAYSTLGRFDDPVLNTMLRWDDLKLVSTLFHELAHQVLYIKDDTRFNESFATAVEEIGIELWLRDHGNEGDMDRYRERKARSEAVFELVERARDDLRNLYASAMAEEDMRPRKAARFERLAEDVARVVSPDGQPGGHWLSEGLNNARLLPVSIYEERVPAFRTLYAECGREFSCFYERAKALSELDADARDAKLDALAASAGPLSVRRAGAFRDEVRPRAARPTIGGPTRSGATGRSFPPP